MVEEGHVDVGDDGSDLRMEGPSPPHLSRTKPLPQKTNRLESIEPEVTNSVSRAQIAHAMNGRLPRGADGGQSCDGDGTRP